MEYKREYEPCIFINDEVGSNEGEKERTGEHGLLEKGEKVTDLGKVAIQIGPVSRSGVEPVGDKFLESRPTVTFLKLC